MLDDLRPLVLFTKTVETGSFRETARIFGLSPSVVSHHISQLEKRHGTALLYRSTRKLSLTETGRQIFNEARLLTRSAETLRYLLTEGSSETSGHLSISVPSALLGSPVMESVHAFAREHPSISFSLMTTDARTDLIADGVDLALRVGDMADSSLKAVAIGEIERELVCSPALASEYPSAHDPEDIAAWPWIRLSMLPPMRNFLGPDGESRTVHFTSRIETDSVIAMHSLTRAGLGVSSPPSWHVVEDVRAGRLIRLLPQWVSVPLPVYAVWPPSAPDGSLSRHLVDHLREDRKPEVARHPMS